MCKSVFCALGDRGDEDAAHVAAHIADSLGWRLVVVFAGRGDSPDQPLTLSDDVAVALRDAGRGSRLLNRLATELGCDGMHRYWTEPDATPEHLADIAAEQSAEVLLLGRSLVRAGYAPAVNAALRERGEPDRLRGVIRAAA